MQIPGEQVINATSSLIDKLDADSRVENDVWSLSGRGHIHQGRAASISVKVGAT